MTEEWRTIPGHPNYEASTHGRIRSITHTTVGKDGVPRTYQGKILATYTRDDMGHQSVPLGYRVSDEVHRLVARTFLGPRPPGLETRHLDGDGSNNRIENLAYGTHSENMIDRVEHGNDAQANRTHCPSGHKLEHPNLRSGHKNPSNGRPWRACYACGKAGEYAARHGIDRAEAADLIYNRRLAKFEKLI